MFDIGPSMEPLHVSRRNGYAFEKWTTLKVMPGFCVHTTGSGLGYNIIRLTLQILHGHLVTHSSFRDKNISFSFTFFFFF